MVKQLLIFATRVPGHVQPIGRPCGTWMHYAMRYVHMFSKPLVCISAAYVTQPHTHAHTCTHICGYPAEASILHSKFFLALALGFAYPLFFSLQSRERHPTQYQDS